MSEPNELLEFSYLWTTEKKKWVIKDLGDNDFLIFNKFSKSALTIDDDDLHEAVVKKMIEEGVEISML
ncbi:MAG: hypothetical protein P8X79_20595 [Reinekea sp.]